ncbi:MAG: MFS transporter [Candidatus Bathyarchaeia archaeon]
MTFIIGLISRSSMETFNVKAARSLKCILCSVFLMQMVMGIVSITTPIYAASLGASQLLLGVIGAAGGLIYSFMPFAMGIISDKIRRRIPIIGSMLLYGVSCIIYILISEPLMLVPIKAIELLATAMFWPSIEAMLVEVDSRAVEETLRRFNLSWSSAAIIGPVIGGMLISLCGVKSSFILSSAVSLTLAITSSILVIEPLKEEKRQKLDHPRLKGADLNQIVMAVAAILLFSFILGIIFNLFPAHAVLLGIPAYEAGIAIFINGLARFLTFSEAYRVEEKIGKIKMFIIGSTAMVFASAIAMISSTTITFSVAFAIYGFGAGILYAASISLIMRWASHAKGYGAGLFESLIGVGYLTGSLSGGAVAEYITINAPYMLSLILSMVISMSYFTLYIRSSKNTVS